MNDVRRKAFLTQKQVFTLLLISFGLCVLILIIYLIYGKEASCFVQYIILILFSATFAIFVFGAIQQLESTGQINAKIFGINIAFGGPAAMMAFLVWAGMHSGVIKNCDPPPPLPFNYTIIIKDTLGDGVNLSNDMLKIWLSGVPTYGITDDFNSRYIFEKIPPDYANKQVNIEFNKKNFFFTNGKHLTSVCLSGTDTVLIVNKDPIEFKEDTARRGDPDTLIPPPVPPPTFILSASGAITDDKGYAIKNAQISTLNGKYVTSSDGNGNFKLDIHSTARKLAFVKVTVAKNGYNPFTDYFNFPSKDHQVFMK